MNIKEVMEFLNAMIDSGLTDEDLKPKPTKNTIYQRDRAIEAKIKEVWSKAEPFYKGNLKGNRYYSLIKELVQGVSSKNILKEYKPFRKNQKFVQGGEVETILIEVKTLAPDKRQILVNGKLWSKPKVDYWDLGSKLLNLLFYMNKDGKKSIKVIIDGEDNTESFKKQVIEKYSNTPLNYFIDYLGHNKHANSTTNPIKSDNVGGIRAGQQFTWLNNGIEHTIYINEVDAENVYYREDGRVKNKKISEFKNMISEMGLTQDYYADGGSIKDDELLTIKNYITDIIGEGETFSTKEIGLKFNIPTTRAYKILSLLEQQNLINKYGYKTRDGWDDIEGSNLRPNSLYWQKNIS
jgi:hypothetical protein